MTQLKIEPERLIDRKTIAEKLQQWWSLRQDMKLFRHLDKELKEYFSKDKLGKQTVAGFVIDVNEKQRTFFQVPENVKEKYKQQEDVVRVRIKKAKK